MQVGDIYLVEIPFFHGHEQAGLRPAIIAQGADIEKLPTVLIIPLTSKIKASDFPFTFTIEPDKSNNLDVPSVVLIFQLRAIDKRRLKDKIGKITQSQLTRLKQSLKEILKLTA